MLSHRPGPMKKQPQSELIQAVVNFILFANAASSKEVVKTLFEKFGGKSGCQMVYFMVKDCEANI